MTEGVKLLASDGAKNDNFGVIASLLGSTGLVGAYYDGDKGYSSGSAYLYRNLNTATGAVTESVKLFASKGVAGNYFGRAVCLDGDNFVIGAYRKNSYAGKAYSGSVSSVTTLDEGGTSRVISSLSFISREDWVIGASTGGNVVTLSAGDAAEVTTAGKAVYIGQEAGSDDNVLTIAGTLTASDVYIGSNEGNVGNTLSLTSTAVIEIGTLHLAGGSKLVVAGDYTSFDALLDYLGGTALTVYRNRGWTVLTSANYRGLVSGSYAAGSTTWLAVVQEPSPPGSR